MKLLLLFALSREIRDVVRGAGRPEKIRGFPFRAFRLRHPSHLLTMAETGMGIDNASAVLRRLLKAERPDGVISVGYCGALSHESQVGDVIWASRVCLVRGQSVESLSLPVRRQLLQRLSLDLPVRAGTFLTMKHWMKKGEMKRFVGSEMALPVCDMETFGLARLAMDRGLPFFAMRTVSDAADKDIVIDPGSVSDRKGNFRLMRAVRLFITHPGLLVHVGELQRNSNTASRSLGMAVRALLQAL